MAISKKSSLDFLIQHLNHGSLFRFGSTGSISLSRLKNQAIIRFPCNTRSLSFHSARAGIEVEMTHAQVSTAGYF